MATDNRPGLETQDVEGRIIAFIRHELLSPEANVDRDDELLSGDMLDSIGLVRLAAFVEEEFQFKMQPADFVIENFQTIAALAEYVCTAADQAGEQPADSGR